MSLIDLPKAKTFVQPKNFHCDTPSDAFEQWVSGPHAALSEDDNCISILEEIGPDGWGGGVTADYVKDRLRAIGSAPAKVQINSPGGNMFEGIAIYNALRSHPAKVEVEILGLAASAASVIAMAGDEITMAQGAMLMIHNAWGMVIGNRHDLSAAATDFEKFDAVLVDVYEARSDLDRAQIIKMMDDETFLNGSAAVEHGFATASGVDLKFKQLDDGSKANAAILARRRIEASLAKDEMTRSERTKLINSLVSPTNSAVRDAGQTPAARDAGIDADLVQSLINNMKS